MKANTIFVIVLLLFFFKGNLYSQEMTPEQKEKLLKEKCFGNQDYLEGYLLYLDYKDQAARPFFKKAAETFEKEKNWEA